MIVEEEKLSRWRSINLQRGDSFVLSKFILNGIIQFDLSISL